MLWPPRPGFQTIARNKRARRSAPFNSLLLRFEALEDRRLLSVSPEVLPGDVPAYGVDLTGRDDLFRVLGRELALLSASYESSAAAGDLAGFFQRPVLSSFQMQRDRVGIVATTTGQVDRLAADLRRLGIVNDVRVGVSVAGWLPVASLDELVGLETVRFARPSLRPLTDLGVTDSQGDVAMRADEARSRFSVNGFTLDGSGVHIGVLSDSFNSGGGAAADIANGDLPGPGNPDPNLQTPVTVVNDTAGIDEGRAMIQLIHDLAPQATFAFATLGIFPPTFVYSSIINNLVNTQQVDILVDDFTFREEPMFQDGVIAQKVDTTVFGSGVPYFTSAGNTGQDSYQNSFVPNSAGITVGGHIAHDFDPGPGVDVFQQITIPEGVEASFFFQWDEPFLSVSPGSGGSTSDLDILLLDNTGLAIAGGLSSNIGGDAIDNFTYFNPLGSGSSQFSIAIRRVAGQSPGAVKYIIRRNGAGDVTIDEHLSANRSTTFGHNNAAGVGSVGAAAFFQTPAFGVDPPVLEGFSARGGLSILFDTAGNRLPQPEVRNKPDFVAPDNVNTSFFGVDIPEDADSFPNFRGTSAASPHAAALAALMLQVDPTLSPSELYQTMQETAIDQGDPGFDVDWGHGLLDTVGAIYKIWTPDAPGLAASVVAGTSQPTFTGDVPAGSFVVLLADGVEVGAQQLPLGATSYSVSPSAPLAPGTYDFTIRLSETAATPVANRSRPSPALQVTIEGTQVPPTAEANGPYAGDEGSAIQFDSTGSGDTDGTITLFEWDFGDGNTATEANPSHAYADDGAFTVTLTVTDNDGLTATDTATVNVANVAPTADAGGPYAGEVGAAVTFAGAATDPGADVLTYAWDFDYDGVTFTADASGVDLTAPSHTYTSSGLFTVALLVTDDDAGTSPIATAQVDVAELQVGPVTFVGPGSVWKYFDQGIDLGAAWRDSAFDDSAWQSGAAQLGYGDGDEVTGVFFGGDPNNKHITTYFRRAFNVADAARVADLTLRLLRDDGAVVYINGQEVKRDNLPDTEILFGTLADTVVSGANESTFFVFPLDSAALVDGLNLLAVEIHQINSTSSDISFDLELTAQIMAIQVPPTAEANGPYSGDEGSAIQFDSTGSSDTDGTIVLFEWDFGDGNTATGTSPSHMYTDDGTFLVTLTVTDNDGLTATDTAAVSVANVAPSADAGGPYAGEAGTAITFAGAAGDPGADALTYAWDFDYDGVTFSPDASGIDLTAPANTYTSPGTFTVALQVTDDDGGVSPVATAPVDVADLQVGPVTFVGPGSVWKYFDQGIDLGTAWRDPSFDDSAWSAGAAQLGYGDGDEVTVVSFGGDANNKHITTYFRHTFHVADAARVADLAMLLLRDDGAVVYINGQEVQRTNLPETGEILFDTRALTFIGGADESVFNPFPLAGGSLVTGVNVLAVEIHQFSPTSSDISFDLELSARITGTQIPPTAEANGPYVGDEGSSVQFNSTGSDDTDGSITFFEWDFGDGNTAAGPNPIHTYADDGSFTVTLTVTDNDGLTATDTATVNVANVAPTADAGGPYSGEVGTAVTFAAAATDPGADVLTYAWDFDYDGVTFTPDASGVDLTAPSHTYTASGIFTVALVVTDDDGASSPLAASLVTIDEAPAAPFLQTGVLSDVNNTEWTTVTLPRTYASMVVVVTPNYDSALPPMVPRIRNAVGNSFEVRMDRLDGSAAQVAGISAHFIVVEEGVYTVAEHGVKMEAVKFTSTVTDSRASFTGQRRDYLQSYTAPVVLGQVMSHSNAAFSTFWSSGRRSNQAPNPTSLFVGKHVGEDPNTVRVDETIGYIVIESGAGTINGRSYLAQLGRDRIMGVGNSPPDTYTFSGPAAPVTAIASPSGMDGNNGGWAVLYGNQPLSATAVNLAIDEDQLNDPERSHTTEQVAFLVFGANASTTTDTDVGRRPPGETDRHPPLPAPPEERFRRIPIETPRLPDPILVNRTDAPSLSDLDRTAAESLQSDEITPAIPASQTITGSATTSGAVDAVMDRLYSVGSMRAAAESGTDSEDHESVEELDPFGLLFGY